MQKADKRPVGRPRMAKELRSSVIPFRVSASERDRMHEAAEREGKTLSDWMRTTLFLAVAMNTKGN